MEVQSVPGKQRDLLKMTQGLVMGLSMGMTHRGRSSFSKPGPPQALALSSQALADLDAWLHWSRLQKEGVVPQGLGEEFFAESKNDRRIESAFARVNFLAGASAPLAGSFRNPLAHSATGWPRQLYWGVALDAPESAIYAYWDAICDQGADSATLAALLAAASHSSGPVDWVRRMIGLSERIPNSRNVLRTVAGAVGSGMAVEAIHSQMMSVAGTSDVFSADLNVGFVSLALLSGAGSMEHSLAIAAGCGGASESVAGYVGAVTAQWYDDFPTAWQSLCDPGLKLELPSGDMTLEQFCRSVFTDRPAPAPSPAPVEVVTVFDETTGYVDEVAAEIPPELPVPPAAPIELPVTTSRSSIHWLDPLVVTIQYEDPPIVFRDRSIQCIVSIENTGDEIHLSPEITHPADWMVAHRAGSARIPRGGKHSFPVVLQPGPTGEGARIKVGGGSVPIFLIRPQNWAVCGPFPNHDGMAFEKVFRCEDVLNTSEVFAGRDGQGTRWRNIELAGTMIDVESFFQGQAGAVYLTLDAEFDSPNQLKCVAASAPGVSVKVNAVPLIKYHHTHQPNSHPMAPYVGSFEPTGRTRFLIKLVRGADPMPPLTFYLVGQDGEIVMPARTFALPS